jgi:RsiW-degrading membrane proteinase PrsW (M82 family)
MNQNYGALRVVRVRPPANASTNLQDRYPSGWLPAERLVHVLTRNVTTIGRALNNDILLMDPTVSREHARLVLDGRGWRVYNLTVNNIVRVNGQPVPSGGSLLLRPQDFLVLGSTMLQLIAPQEDSSSADVYGGDRTAPVYPGPTMMNRAMPPIQGVAQNGSNGQTAYSSYRSLPPQQQLPGNNGSSQPLMANYGSPVPPGTNGSLSSVLPVQPEPELRPQSWDGEEERLLDVGVTMQFALPQRMGKRTRWLIGGFGIAILLVSAIVTLVLNSVIGLNALTQNGPSSILAALTIPIIPAVVIVLLVNFIDRYEREPWFLQVSAFLWGAIIAIPPSLVIEQNIAALTQNWLGNDASDLVRALSQGLNAGVTEETIKGLGLLLLFFILRDEFDNVTDGIVYGALIGAGFAMVENFVYFAVNSKGYLLFLIVGRVVLGWLCHSTFTVCFGAALGYVRHTRVRWRQILIPLLGFLLAVGLHTVFDFVDDFANLLVLAHPDNPTIALLSLVAVIGDYIPPFIAQVVLLYILIKSLAHEAAVIREFLAHEVSSGVVTVDEYALLQNAGQRIKAERRVLRKKGFRQWLRVRALYQTEIGLAFRKWHVSMGDKPKLGYRQPEDAYRQRINRLRQDIIKAGVIGA